VLCLHLYIIHVHGSFLLCLGSRGNNASNFELLLLNPKFCTLHPIRTVKKEGAVFGTSLVDEDVKELL
jgi:hypothetical protein